jgi:hypothetical protein
MKSGTALPVVLLTLAMTSALVVSGAFVSRRLVADQRLVERGALLESSGEQALVDAVARWDSAARAVQLVGASDSLATIASSGVATAVWVTRMSDQIYWFVAEASDDGGKPRLRRRLGLVIRVFQGVPALVSERAWSELP